MIITIAGKPGAGKTTAAKKLAKILGYKHLSMGDLRGKIAMKHGMTIDELNRLGKKQIWTDKEVDDELVRIGKEEDNYVIDTWIGFHFIPHSVKIFLDVDPKIGAERVFKDQRPDEPKKKTVKDVEMMQKKRLKETAARYKKWYKVDISEISHYDLIIDTTKLTKKEVVDKILGFVKEKT